MVLAETAVIREQLVEGVAERAAVRDFGETAQADGVAEEGVVVGLALALDEVETEVDAELQAGKRALLETAQVDEGTGADVVGR